MEFVPEIVLALIVVLMGVVVTRVTQTQHAELKQDIRDVRSEMNERFRDLSREIADIRSDVTQLAFAMGQVPKPQTG